jgi:hypothetical protein
MGTVTLFIVDFSRTCSVISHLESSLSYSVCSCKFCAIDGLRSYVTGVAKTAELLTFPPIDIDDAILSPRL